jgi:tRNA-splicing ligase RtcB
MDIARFTRRSESCWELPPRDGMRVPAVIFASEALLAAMDDKVAEQACNVARLPGIVQASYAMPDAHWGYGFPIGGVAAFDPEQGGVVSAGGVGYDISCGVRCLYTGLKAAEVRKLQPRLADALLAAIPAGVGSAGSITLDGRALDAMLAGGARWAVERGFGDAEDLQRTEERGCVAGADPAAVSPEARRRQLDQVGTLGSGNHYLEVQRVAAVHDERLAQALELAPDDVVVSIHCGSRGLGHQIGTEFLRRMAAEAAGHGLKLPDRELACAPLASATGRAYLGAMRAAINAALANRQVLTHLTRRVFAKVLPAARLPLLYDVSHNTCKEETHDVGGRPRRLFVHRKGATRAFGPGHPELPPAFHATGQPVLIGGSMGTASFIMAGTRGSMGLAFGSACHGAGRAMSRNEAGRRWDGRRVTAELAQRGILVRSPSPRGVAEEAPGAYKDVVEVVQAAERAGLARTVARLEPLVCIKG